MFNTMICYHHVHIHYNEVSRDFWKWLCRWNHPGIITAEYSLTVTLVLNGIAYQELLENKLSCSLCNNNN